MARIHIVTLALALALGLGIAQASAGELSAENFPVLGDAQAEVLSDRDMAEVRGREFFVPCVIASVCGFPGGNALPGNWSWTSGLFSDLRTNYPQVWYPMFPLSYPQF